MATGSEVSKTYFAGARGAEFTRVQAVFQAAGFQPPKPDVTGGEGAYVSNIVDQYRADLLEMEVLAFIAYGLTMSLATIQQQALGRRQIVADWK